MTLSQRLRTCAKHTGLDAVIELLQEAADEIDALQARAQVQGELEPYDAGLLNDFGGGNVEWWQDYIRAELGRAHDFYQSQLAIQQAEVTDGIRPEDFTVDVVVKPMGGFAPVNTQGVRVTHKPTGVSVTCDAARSQHTNRQQAFEKLSAILALHPERVPMTDEQIRSMCKQGWVFETARQWVHVIESHHGITAQAKKENQTAKRRSASA